MHEFESLLLHVLLQLALIIAAARGGAWLLSKAGQPQVVGEILAGLLLGPSLLGRFHPRLVEFFFPAETADVLPVLSEIGLVMLMFLIGLEFDFAHLSHIGRTAATIGKMGGCGLAARLGGLTWRDSGCVAVMMNTRALMGLIAINVGRQMGVVPDNIFGMLVIMAVVTTLITTPLLRRLLPGACEEEDGRLARAVDPALPR